jgi:septum formation protein
VDETFPRELKAEQIALYLAEKKAAAFPEILKENEVLLTADTIVWINGEVLNKPTDENDSFSMLSAICGATHQVYTGVCLKTAEQTISFFDKTNVTCHSLTDEEKWHYIRNYKPFDKAGSYGIQDWFGYTAVERINGCFYNVMGLPVGKVYETLKTLA